MKPARVGSPVHWHQDLAYYPHTNEGVLAVLIYIDDATEANGCLQVLPGRHHRYFDHHRPEGAFAGRITEAIEPEPEPRTLPAPAGSAIFLHGLTPHSSLPNRSSADRRTLILAYRAGDAYPLYYGRVTAEDEAVHRPVRGRRAPATPASAARRPSSPRSPGCTPRISGTARTCGFCWART